MVDFYCPKAKLIIEVDGGYHSDRIEYDKERQQIIEQLGLRFLRFSDKEVYYQIDEVIITIEKNLV